jgi:hypothetical protein
VTNKPKYFFIKSVFKDFKDLDSYFCSIYRDNKYNNMACMITHRDVSHEKVTPFETAALANSFLQDSILCYDAYKQGNFIIVYNDGAIEVEVTEFNQ